MSDRPGRALGVDLGSKRVGVAISDDQQSVATPLEVLDGTDWDSLGERLSEIVEEWEIAIIVICLLYTSPSPRDQRGSRMPSSA